MPRRARDSAGEREQLPYEVPVGCRYGSPMGRRSDPVEELTGKVRLRKVPFVDGDYDPGGAYWGGGSAPPLYCAWDYDSHVYYLRAPDREEAKHMLFHLNPTILFHR